MAMRLPVTDTSAGLDLLLLDGTTDTAAKYTRFPSEAPCTSNHTQLVARVQRTSTDTATQTGRRT